jgi:predicted transposase YbfD/YdcC
MAKEVLGPLFRLALETFGEVQDPRVDRTKLHPLMNVIVMALCGSLGGAKGWDDVVFFCHHRKAFFAQFLDLRHGVPSADTFRRVFESVDVVEFETAFRKWVAGFSKSFEGEVVAIDGKSLRSAAEHAGSTPPLHLLHAWAVDQHLLLGQQRVEGAPGEVGGIAELLERLHIDGAVVTTDANGCTQLVTSAIRAAKADYVLALKGNRRRLFDHAKAAFESAESNKFKDVESHASKDKGHGRTETRIVRAIKIADGAISKDWCDAQSIVMVDRTRTTKSTTTKQRSYYVSSLSPDPEKIGRAIRSHWGIENQLHWMLDVLFDEDKRKIREKRAAENFALISKMALIMLKKSPEKASTIQKMRLVNWSTKYLGELLAAGI